MVNCFRSQVLAALAGVALFSAAAMAAPQQGSGMNKDVPKHPLAWAYAIQDPPPAPPAAAPKPDDAEVKHLSGSSVSFTVKQLSDSTHAIDWFPNEHPAMPEIVSHRRSPGVNPWIGNCAWCHMPEGRGRPENAGIAGLPAGYILEQLADFKNGARRAADPGKRNTATMAGNAGGLTDEEARAAAEYYASLKMPVWIKVIETDTVPKYRNVNGFFYAPVEGTTETVPLGQQILEMPVDLEAAEGLRSPKASWIAYVPVGSLKRGEELVKLGGAGKTVACAACHGDDLRGNGNFPPIAGRSPSYLARQLYDIQQYTRNGPGTQLMRPVVQNLSQDDILAITAYLASLEP